LFVLRAEAEVRPTEDVEKVKKALLNIVEVKDVRHVRSTDGYSFLICESRSITALSRLYELLRQQRILDTARRILQMQRQGNTISIKLHKQSAYAGHVSFVTYDDESPLGPITVTIVSDKIDEIIDWLAPKTSRGRPLWEREAPKV